MQHQLFSNFMLLSVIINTIGLSIDHYLISAKEAQDLKIMNYFFTAVFITELALKLTGLGFIKYLNDKMNYLDATVVILSIVELALINDKTNLSVFRSMRILRIFRVLRVAKSLKSMKSMLVILGAI